MLSWSCHLQDRVSELLGMHRQRLCNSGHIDTRVRYKIRLDCKLSLMQLLYCTPYLKAESYSLTVPCLRPMSVHYSTLDSICQKLDFLLPSWTSIGSSWQTEWHEVDPFLLPALIMSKNSVDIMLSDLTGSLALIKHLLWANHKEANHLEQTKATPIPITWRI